MVLTPPPEASVSRVTRFGTAVGAGTLAAFLASIPAALRVSPHADARLGVTGVLLALAAASLLPTVFAVVVLRGARRGLAAFGGQGAGARALGFGMWAVWTAVALTVFGAALRATTHHHALAGVTFALGALFVALLLAVIVRRVVAMVEHWPVVAQRLCLGACIALPAGFLLFCCLRIARTSSYAVAMPIDLLAYLIAAGFASRASFARRRAFAIVGPPLAALVLAYGISSLRRAPSLQTLVHVRAPLLAWPVDRTAQLIREY